MAILVQEPGPRHERYCAEIELQVKKVRQLVTSGADLTATVPTCPDWTLEHLLRHIGGALRWVEANVRTRAKEEFPEADVPLYGGPEGQGDPAALDAWLAESGAMTVAALREAGPDAPVWSWGWEHSAGFWARRMAHELVVHGADAALTVGRAVEVAPEIAADTIDEWLEIVEFVQRTMPHDEAAELRGPGRTIHLHATDTPPEADAERSDMGVPPPEGWGRVIELTEDVMRRRRGHEKATVALRGPLTEVLLAFYRRMPPDGGELQVLGDRELLDFWLRRATFG
ncbi:MULTISPECIES: maleylpyruvate isomerase N-terminal domain-containing protein [Streptomyces]|uniref:Maleylpyruvate isomerase N-terminal domain-containing protein n=1 Tax=Streptomyces caniscabiei TaxID=2746961 RepID=A0ABU4MSP1_9ACTN|nr:MULTISPECIES: maleylpyruvate isomerase N-terminal domain-containing protein [Streptomyces]MBE4735794.1 maleylpyruvate isomerase family mycothiol-dependent enzyme [Streptomyces caniscabiei]MBE4758411.1 maleylpyruvate isomerase family mycothiol-dependent enzyme [Streptomyces caniscabiei]MBE4774155.1 maleylpyruvate isomerase family mycothiol-dependent enzyme [Streptomyces caniscabiei]MBE4788502.1 maleylpyruvate isomerase family mycothiol-dependent enzyme [Streptomyces caniscabiei]MBE4796210.1 